MGKVIAFYPQTLCVCCDAPTDNAMLCKNNCVNGWCSNCLKCYKHCEQEGCISVELDYKKEQDFYNSEA